MVIVDEIWEAVVDALVVWHMRIGRMDAHRFRHDLRQRPAATQQFIIDSAAAFLIAGQHAVFELLIEASRFLTAICCGCGVRWHESALLGRGRYQTRLILPTARQPR